MQLTNGHDYVSFYPVKFKTGEVSNAFVIRSQNLCSGGQCEQSYVGKLTATSEVKNLLNQGYTIDFTDY